MRKPDPSDVVGKLELAVRRRLEPTLKSYLEEIRTELRRQLDEGEIIIQTDTGGSAESIYVSVVSDGEVVSDSMDRDRDAVNKWLSRHKGPHLIDTPYVLSPSSTSVKGVVASNSKNLHRWERGFMQRGKAGEEPRERRAPRFRPMAIKMETDPRLKALVVNAAMEAVKDVSGP